MNLLLLDGTKYNNNYKGTDRFNPLYVDGLPDTHPANQAFFWYVYNRDDAFALHDLSKAHEVVEAYRNLSPAQYFEIIEVTTDEEVASTKSEFLGFDLSTGSYSLLSPGVEITQFNLDTLPIDDKLRVIHPLVHLIQTFFRPKLNSNGLFDDYTIAKFCLDCMLSLQNIRPDLWENDTVIFKVMGIWRVRAE